MRLLQHNSDGQFSLTDDLNGDCIPKYAILSHTWGPDHEEVTFEDIVNGTGEDKPGYEKIRFGAEQARQDGLLYFWIDTCCIDKRNGAELSRSINSLFRWNYSAARCYVYLSDVSKRKRDGISRDTWESDFRRSRWFTRGWTLQDLLAPASVEFFSLEGQRLGDKSSLKQQIHEITDIPELALQGGPLSQFSVNERLRWMEHRSTKLEEDKAYALQGIFGVYIPPLYGEGLSSAFKRLLEEIEKHEKCIRDIRVTDPRDDKKRIEHNNKAGLPEDTYHWIIDNPDFQRWRNNQQSQLLWIRGDHGKGKTMLLCGIINELKSSIPRAELLSYYFFQATDSRMNKATAMLRSLIYLLVDQQSSLVSHVRKRYDQAGNALFEDANAWFALSEILTNILQDPSLNTTYLIIDALDECGADLPKLLDFIVQNLLVCPRVRWILSSCNGQLIEEQLGPVGSKVVLGMDTKDTFASKEPLQKVILAQSSSARANPLMETVASRLSNFFVEGMERPSAYTDSEIQQVSLLLRQVDAQWSRVPRTYITLRTIGSLDILNSFIDLGFSDHWFPVTEKALPHCLRPSQRSRFVAAQHLVMTKSMDLERGNQGRHCHFSQNEPLPFEEKGILGTGGFGQVDRVLSLISFREYARKRVPRSTIFGGRRTEDVKRFIAEIDVLKRVKHGHVVEFVGSYTDPKYMGLIISPVANMDLATYLARADATRHRELRTFFGCLARALEFLHGESIRHKDIKPGNILVHGGNVLFTDFGLAFDFKDAEGSTTVSMVNAMTPRYCAPEVANHEPRNTSSDIWSLGVVFLEMITVLKGRTVVHVYDFLAQHGSRQAYVRTNTAGLYELITELKETGDLTDNVVLGWIQDMLIIQQNLRPTAAALTVSITVVGGDENGGYCGICCMSPDDFVDNFTGLEIT